MRSSAISGASRLLIVSSLLLGSIACGNKGKPEPKAEGAKAEGAKAEGEAGDVVQDGAGDEAPPAEAEGSGDPPADAGPIPVMQSGGDTGSPDADGGGTGGGGTGGGSTSGAPGTSGADAEGGEGADSSTGGGPDVLGMLKEVTRTKVKDDRAFELLAEAEEAGAEARDLAKAANSRGERLHATPDRAKTFFTWSNDKDETYPVAAFNLAKQAAVLGELEEAKTWLAVVKERKGKKLLQQIDFDPMWEILKDDPDVRALLK